MRGLTLIQPWATHVIHGGKRIENRKVNAPAALVGQRFAVHAGLKYNDNAPPFVSAEIPVLHGHVIGVARIERVITTLAEADAIGQAHWWQGPFAYVLDERIPITPIECRGMQGWWPLPDHVERHVLAELANDRP